MPRVFPQTRNFRKEIREVAARCNLSDNQADFFMRLCARYRISNPLYLLRNEKILDELFSRAFHALQTGDTATKDAEVSKTILFTLREAIDNYRKLSTVIKSTRSVESGMELLLVTPQEEQYPTVVLENSARGLVCRLPRDEFGNEIRLPIWSKVGLSFQRITANPTDVKPVSCGMNREPGKRMVLSPIPIHSSHYRTGNMNGWKSTFPAGSGMFVSRTSSVESRPFTNSIPKERIIRQPFATYPRAVVRLKPFTLRR